MRALNLTRAAVLAGLFGLVVVIPANGQSNVVDIPGPNLRETLRRFGETAGSAALGDALAFGPALELATAPLGSATGGFTVVFDAATGAFTRGAETFGPAFAQRALTTGKGKASFGLSWQYAKFDEIAGADLGGFTAFVSTGILDQVPTESNLNFDIRSSTVSLFGTVGLTNRIDIGITVPISSISLEGEVTQTYLFGPDSFDSADQSAAGLGDIALQGKVLLWKSQRTAGATASPASSLATIVSARLPTGDEENLRSLGFARTKVSGVFSQHASRFAFHASAGYEFWADQIKFARDIFQSEFAETNNAWELALATEVAAGSRLTINAELLYQEVRGAGALGVEPFDIPIPGFPDFEAATIVGLEQGLRKWTLVPGFRWNMFGQALLNAHVLVSLKNDGLRAKFVPAVGFDWTF
jgi:hypothetical protein